MTERLMFAHFPGLEVPREFVSWPAHITLLHWFEMESKWLHGLIEHVRFAAEGFHHMETVAREEAMFGENNEKLVNILDHGPSLRELHRRLLSIVHDFEGTVVDPQWTDSSYKPHITRKADLAFSPGDIFVVANFSLVRAVSEIPKQREIVETFSLKPVQALNEAP